MEEKNTIHFEYFYGNEAEQFAFYRIPKALFKEECFKMLSTDAKLLYGLMLDRASLSVKNGWIDESNRAFIYYKYESIMEDLGCGREKCSKVIAELDSVKGVGLIERKKQGQGNPDKIYVKNFATVLSEESDKPEVRKSKSKKSENRTSRNSEVESAEVGKSNGNNTELNNTENSKTNLILSQEKKEIKDEIEIYEEIIKNNISYDDLLIAHPREKTVIDGICELMLEVMVDKNETIIISSNRYPTQLVRSKFMKLKYSHITYVLDCMNKNTSSVKNIKKYMLATLFNAPSTIDSYYIAMVNHDMPQFAQ
jgi:hypothetical protein